MCSLVIDCCHSGVQGQGLRALERHRGTASTRCETSAGMMGGTRPLSPPPRRPTASRCAASSSSAGDVAETSGLGAAESQGVGADALDVADGQGTVCHRSGSRLLRGDDVVRPRRRRRGCRGARGVRGSAAACSRSQVTSTFSEGHGDVRFKGRDGSRYASFKRDKTGREARSRSSTWMPTMSRGGSRS